MPPASHRRTPAPPPRRHLMSASSDAEAVGRRPPWWRRRGPCGGVGWRRLVLALTTAAATLTLLVTCAAPFPIAAWLLSPPPEVQLHSSYRAALQNSVIAVTPPPQSSPPPPPLLPPPPPPPPPSPLINTTQLTLPPLEFSPVLTPPANSSGSVPSPPHFVSSPISERNPGRTGEKAQERSKKNDDGWGSRLERQKKLWSLPPDEALLYAKREIENAPLVSDDPDLYPPLFRNISTFKRSYELMEKILKVYIYPGGSRPIFHTPQLRGIYASEGWFMKLLEESRQFVTRDPNKAHLFYLPYSARQLQVALYVPNSHNMRPLSLFLRDYVDTIAAKYPFWNRTHGSDHFLVACHDWGPYTVVEHAELLRNTIKALCNADVSERIFIRGRDVSLPETTIRTPRKPLRNLGGKPVSKRNILAFYAGGIHGPVRPVLSKYWEGKDQDVRVYEYLPNSVSRKMSYIQHMKSSRFCLCPMGYEVNSPRIVEAIYYECVPVIIADNLVPPLDEVLDWSKFSVSVAEKDIPNLKEILSRIPLRQYVFLHTNVQRLQKHFLWHPKPIKYDMFNMILHSIWFNRLNHITVIQQ